MLNLKTPFEPQLNEKSNGVVRSTFWAIFIFALFQVAQRTVWYLGPNFQLLHSQLPIIAQSDSVPSNAKWNLGVIQMQLKKNKPTVCSILSVPGYTRISKYFKNNFKIQYPTLGQCLSGTKTQTKSPKTRFRFFGSSHCLSYENVKLIIRFQNFVATIAYLLQNS